MQKWESLGHGIEARRHESRKHGVRFDRYFRGRYTLNKKTYVVGFGWESEGWTQARCIKELELLKENAKTGQGPATLKEKQRIAEAARRMEEERRTREERESMAFSDLFEQHYLPAAQVDKKSWDRDFQLYRDWIAPVIGSKRLVDVSEFDIERIKKRSLDAGKSPRTVQYILATARHVFNFARQRRLIERENPVSFVKKPTPNNRRVRFLTREEADQLLTALLNRSETLFQIASMSLYCGLRFGEVAALTWGDIDLEQGSLFVRDPKNRQSRTTFMPQHIKVMIRGMKRSTTTAGEFVFPSRKGEIKDNVSKTFSRTVMELGFNDGVDDPRQKVVFHSLRHTFASWLAMEGIPMATLKELLGHKSLAMTERYSHLSPNKLQTAVRLLDRSTEEPHGVVLEPREGVGEDLTRKHPEDLDINRKNSVKIAKQKR